MACLHREHWTEISQLPCAAPSAELGTWDVSLKLTSADVPAQGFANAVYKCHPSHCIVEYFCIRLFTTADFLRNKRPKLILRLTLDFDAGKDTCCRRRRFKVLTECKRARFSMKVAITTQQKFFEIVFHRQPPLLTSNIR